MQLSCHTVAVVLTLVETKQTRINTHKQNSTKNTKRSKYKYAYYQNTRYKTHTYTHTHTHTHTQITKQVITATVQDAPK